MEERDFTTNETQTQENLIEKDSNNLKTEIEEWIEERAKEHDCPNVFRHMEKEEIAKLADIDWENFDSEKEEQKDIDYIKSSIEENISELNETGFGGIESYIFLKKERLVKTPEEFKEVWKNENTEYYLSYADKENLKYAIDLYQHRTPQGFIEMCENESVMEVIAEAKIVILEYVVDLYQIKNFQEFEKMCENENVKNVVKYSRKKNFDYVINLYQIKTTQEFEKMCKNINIRYVLDLAKEKNLEYIVDLYNIKTPQEFEKMCENENVRHILKSQEENFELIVDLYNIKTPQEFEKMCEDVDVDINYILLAKKKFLQYAIQNNILTKENISKITYESIDSLSKAVNIEQPNEQEITFLQKLFNQHISSANNVLEVISNNESITIEQDHEDIFDMIDKLGNISPVIFEKYKTLDSKERDIYADEINKKKKEMFKNKPIDIKDFDETAELIYLAYNPIGMSLEAVKEYLRNIKDRTEDLEKYKFPKDGYEITIENQTEKVIKKEKKINFENIDYVAKIIKESTEKNKEEDYNRKVSEVLDKISKASPSLDSDSLSYLISIMNNESVTSLSEKHYDRNNINDLYSYLSQTKEVLGVIFKDNFKEELKNFLNENTKTRDRIIKTFQEEKRKEIFIRAIRKEFEKDDEKKDDEMLTDKYWENLNTDKISELLSTFVQNKIIKTERTKISKELNKIEEKDQKGTSRMKKEKINLKVYISKNIGSFFAKASAGICTSDDTELFNRKKHFHMNLAENIGKNNEIIRGNVQAYIIDDNGEESLLIRGINPNSTFLYEADEKSLCDELIKIAIKFKDDNNLKAVYLSEQLEGYHALSNRPSVLKYLDGEYLKKKNEKECNVGITMFAKIGKMYEVG